jgi:hypothetical protein
VNPSYWWLIYTETRVGARRHLGSAVSVGWGYADAVAYAQRAGCHPAGATVTGVRLSSAARFRLGDVGRLLNDTDRAHMTAALLVAA